MSNQSYNPKRIKRAVDGYLKDMDRIVDENQANRNEMGRLLREIEERNDKIKALREQNKARDVQYHIIKGKVEGLEQVLSGSLPDDDE